MSKINIIRNLSPDDIITLADDHTSITSMLEHLIGYGHDPRCRKLLKDKAATIGIKLGNLPPIHYKFSDSEFKEFVANAICLADAAREMGMSDHSNNCLTLTSQRQLIAESMYILRMKSSAKILIIRERDCRELLRNLM